MNRRAFIGTLACGLLAAPLAAEAQRADKVVRVGFLDAVSSRNVPWIAAFERRLVELGYVEGKTDGDIDRLTALARDLVRRKVNVFVATGGTGSVVKAKPVVPKTIPIVFAMGGDPVKLGVSLVLHDRATTSRG